SKLTPSTALTAPTWRANTTPRVMGKCLTRVLTCNSGVSAEASACACSIATLTHLLPHRLLVRVDEARRFVAFCPLQKFTLAQRLTLTLPDGAEDEHVDALGVEHAAVRHVLRAVVDALHDLQPHGLLAHRR